MLGRSGRAPSVARYRSAMDTASWLDARPEDPGAVRVVSFNVRNGIALAPRHCWWRRRKLVLATLLRLDADLVGLQEVYGFQGRWLLRHLPAYGGYGVGRTDGKRRGEQVPILYRRDRYLVRHRETRWFSGRPTVAGSRWPGARFPRTASILELEDRHDGHVLGFVNTHLDAHDERHRVSSAALLVAWLSGAENPTILVGDLNEGGDGPAVVQLVEQAHLRPAVPADAGGSNHDFTGATDGRRLDHVLVSAAWRVLAGAVDHRRVDGRLASDHWPVVADVVRAPSP